MTRPMTAAEKQQYRRIFPNLDVDNAVVSGEATPVYNCLAWTLGYIDRWLWPGNTASDFDTLYNAAGFSRANNGPISAWGSSLSAMTHGSISGAGHGPRWESKLGQGLRIQHGLSELEGVAYGKPLYFYEKRAEIAAGPSVEEIMNSLVLSDNEQRLLEEDIRAVPEEIRRRFDELYARWSATWNRPEIAISSDPAVVSGTEEFESLVGLGPAILPLVAGKLVEPNQFFALQLYDAIWERDSRKVPYFDDDRILGGEQLRAAQTVKLYLTR